MGVYGEDIWRAFRIVGNRCGFYGEHKTLKHFSEHMGSILGEHAENIMGSMRRTYGEHVYMGTYRGSTCTRRTYGEYVGNIRGVCGEHMENI